MNVEEERPLVEEKDSINNLDDEPNAHHSFKHTFESLSFVIFLLCFEFVIIVLSFILVRNGQDLELTLLGASNSTTNFDHNVVRYYNYFLDVCVMIFIGFGMLMTFLKKEGYFAMGMTFLISCVVAQLSFFLVGYSEKIVDLIHEEEDIVYYIVLDFPLLIKSLYAAGAVLISMGVLIGKITPMQLLLMAVMEVFFYSINVSVVEGLLGTSDVGGSLLIHTFGAYFGLSTSFASTRNLFRKKDEYSSEGATSTSNLMSIIGTVWLWMYWPSFNAALEEDVQRRVIFNTFLSLTGSCISAFAFSRLLRVKFELEDLQNSTIAGGVAVGAASNMRMLPGGPLCIGVVAGAVSVFGYKYLSALLKKCYIHDSCGHGIPGLIGGVASIFASITISGNGSEYLHKKFQPLFQLAGVAITFVIAILSGFVAGIVLRVAYYPKQGVEFFDDNAYFDHSGENEKKL